MDIRSQIARLTEEGWRSRDYTLTSKQTYIWGTLIALPFVALAGGLYRVFLLDEAVLLDHTSLILLAVIVVSLPVHEILHGLGWALAGRLGMDEIKFLFQHGMPMCTCCCRFWYWVEVV